MSAAAILRVAGWLTLCLALAGCYVVSDEIVGGATAGITDEALPGLWRAVGKPGYMLISTNRDGLLCFRFFEAAFREDSEYFCGTASHAGGERFLNLKRFFGTKEEPADKGYIPARYSVDARRLRIALLNTAFLASAIRAGKVAGIAPAEREAAATQRVRVTAKGEDLARFLLANGKRPDLFDEPVVLERIQTEQ